MKMKICTKCDESKTVDEFGPGPNEDGLHKFCRECVQLIVDANTPTQTKKKKPRATYSGYEFLAKHTLNEDATKKARDNHESKKTATRVGMPWTDEENDALKDYDTPLQQIAKELGRSLSGCRNQRENLQLKMKLNK